MSQILLEGKLRSEEDWCPRALRVIPIWFGSIQVAGWKLRTQVRLKRHSMKFLLRRRFLYVAVLLCLGTWSSQVSIALINGDGDPDVAHRRASRAGFAETIVIPGPLPSF